MCAEAQIKTPGGEPEVFGGGVGCRLFLSRLFGPAAEEREAEEKHGPGQGRGGALRATCREDGDEDLRVGGRALTIGWVAGRIGVVLAKDARVWRVVGRGIVGLGRVVFRRHAGVWRGHRIGHGVVCGRFFFRRLFDDIDGDFEGGAKGADAALFHLEGAPVGLDADGRGHGDRPGLGGAGRDRFAVSERHGD